MADYYPLIARALEGLPDRTPEAREAVYERARAALGSQLHAVQPPLGENAIETEQASLEEAIARAERMARSEGIADMPGADRIVPGREVDDLRPPAIRRGGRGGRSLITAVALVVVIAPLAGLAWLWRDQPVPAPAPAPAPPPPTAPAPGDPKRPERVGGGGGGRPADPAPPPTSPVQPGGADPGTPAPPPPGTGGGGSGGGGGQPAPPIAGDPTPPAPPSPQPEVAVAQRAALVEENTADPQQPKVTSGRVVWRLDGLNAGQGQPLETVIRAAVEVPEAGMTLALTMRRNRDSTLPASHIIELEFKTTAGSRGVVSDVNAPLVRPDDGSRGVPLAGLAVPVKENVFLVGLSDLRADVERNSELIVKRNWFELPLRFASGLRATVVFEKGTTGDRIVADAFRQWGQAQP